jgi:hypothetical protein
LNVVIPAHISGAASTAVSSSGIDANAPAGAIVYSHSRRHRRCRYLGSDLAGHEVSAATGVAVPAMSSVPPDSDPLAAGPSRDAGADSIDDAGDLMSGDARVLHARPESLRREGVAVTNAARLHPDAYASWSGSRNLAFDHFEAALRPTHLHDTHVRHWSSRSPNIAAQWSTVSDSDA